MPFYRLTSPMPSTQSPGPLSLRAYGPHLWLASSRLFDHSILSKLPSTMSSRTAGFPLPSAPLQGLARGTHWGGALFAFRLHSAQALAEASAPDAVFATFADDTHILAPVSAIEAAFEGYTAAVTAVGLQVSVGKCRLWGPPRGSLPEGLLPHISRPASGLRILGVPFGDAASLDGELDDAYEDWTRALDEVSALGNAQVAFALLRQCATARPRNLQRVLYPAPEVLALYRRFDRRLRKVAAELLGVEVAPLDASAGLWLEQAALPVKWGGLGLGDLALTASVVHLAC